MAHNDFVKYFCSHGVQYVFDFRGKRVKCSENNSKFSVVDKFTLSYFVRTINYYKGLYLSDISNYYECSSILLDLFKSNNFVNVSILV